MASAFGSTGGLRVVTESAKRRKPPKTMAQARMTAKPVQRMIRRKTLRRGRFSPPACCCAVVRARLLRVICSMVANCYSPDTMAVSGPFDGEAGMLSRSGRIVGPARVRSDLVDFVDGAHD